MPQDVGAESEGFILLYEAVPFGQKLPSVQGFGGKFRLNASQI